MADLQVGNPHGVMAAGTRVKLAEITATGANTVTVAATNLPKLHAGMVIDILTEADGTEIAEGRTITSITSAGVVTYSGADEDGNITTGDDSIYLPNSWEPNGDTMPLGVNGGPSAREGFLDDNLMSISRMRARLTAIDATAYSSANLDAMSVNDMMYALRLNDNAEGFIQ